MHHFFQCDSQYFSLAFSRDQCGGDAAGANRPLEVAQCAEFFVILLIKHGRFFPRAGNDLDPEFGKMFLKETYLACNLMRSSGTHLVAGLLSLRAMKAVTSVRVGMPARPPCRVHFNAATALANRMASATSAPSARASV